MTNRLISPFLLLLSFITQLACTKSGSNPPPNPPQPPSSEKNITSFVFSVINNPALPADVIGLVGQDTIKAVFPYGTSLTNLIPTIIFTGNSINPPNSGNQNFTNIVTYRVTAQDGTFKNYFVLARNLPLPIINSQVNTFAGSGVPGFLNNIGLSAQFNGPAAISRDTSGNLYIADRNNKSIRKIDPTGSVSTIFTFNYSLSWPTGIALDAAGNIYVAESFINTIKKISPSGTESNFATGFNNPTDVAVDASGNVFVVDNGNNRIKKVTPAGVVTTFAGSDTSQTYDGIGNASYFISPKGITIDGAGNLYVTEYSTIRKITPNATVSTIAGVFNSIGFADGNAFSALFWNAKGITIDFSGNLFVSEYTRIRKITPAGFVSTVAGTGSHGNLDGPGNIAEFSHALGVVADAIGNLFIADYTNNKIRKVTF